MKETSCLRYLKHHSNLTFGQELHDQQYENQQKFYNHTFYYQVVHGFFQSYWLRHVRLSVFY